MLWSSGVIPKLLNPATPYFESWDQFYLEVILRTKGREALPGLVSYLESLVAKMKGQPLALREFEERQPFHNERVYKLMVQCLEAITGRKSAGNTREEVLKFWQDYMQQRKRGALAEPPGVAAHQRRPGDISASTELVRGIRELEEQTRGQDFGQVRDKVAAKARELIARRGLPAFKDEQCRYANDAYPVRVEIRGAEICVT